MLTLTLDIIITCANLASLAIPQALGEREIEGERERERERASEREYGCVGGGQKEGENLSVKGMKEIECVCERVCVFSVYLVCTCVYVYMYLRFSTSLCTYVCVCM